MPRRSVSRSSSSSVCHASSSSVSPLKRLADHHEGRRCAGRGRRDAGSRAARPPPVAPLGAEHDEVVRPHRLHLAPRLAAPAGGVQRRRVLDDDALVPGARAPRRARAAASSALAVKTPGILSCRRDRLEPRAALAQRRVEQIVAVDVQDVEEERRDPLRRRPRRRCGATVSWNAAGPSSAIQSASPSSTAWRTGSSRTASTIPGSACGDVVEVARVDAHLVAAAVDLDADAVELPLDRRQLEAGDGLARRSRRVEASIGRTGRKSSKPTARSPASPSASAISAVRVRSPESISARRASSAGTPAAFATASTMIPASAPCRSSPVNSRRTKSASSSVARANRSSSSRRLAAHGSASGRFAWIPSRARSRSSTVSASRSPAAGSRRVDGRVADPDPSLPRDAREQPGDDRHLGRARACEAARRGSRPSPSASLSRRPLAMLAPPPRAASPREHRTSAAARRSRAVFEE